MKLSVLFIILTQFFAFQSKLIINRELWNIQEIFSAVTVLSQTIYQWLGQIEQQLMTTKRPDIHYQWHI